MKSRSTLIPRGAALAAMLLGAADAMAACAGGTSVPLLLAFGVLLALTACGAWRALRTPSDSAVPARLPAVLLTSLALILPWAAPWLAPHLAGPPLSLATLGALLLWILSTSWPMLRLGGALARQAESTGSAAWNLLGLGALLGISAVARWGLGPLGTLIAGGLWIVLPNPVGPPTPEPEDPPSSATPRFSLSSPFLLAASAVAGLLYLLPLLETLDGSAAPEDAARLLALGGAALLLAMLLGSAMDRSQWGSLGVSVLAGAVAAGWWLAARHFALFADSRAFNYVVGHGPLVEYLGGGDRLHEGNPWYTPYLSLWVAAFPMLALGAALRGALALPRRTASALGALLAGGGSCAAVLALGAARLAPERGAIAFGLALLAGILAALGSRRGSPFLRVTLALGIAALPFVGMDPPRVPNTTLPFFDNFTYRVAERGEQRAEYPSTLSHVRVLERDAAPRLGHWMLADGRNLLLGDSDFDRILVAESRFAAELAKGSTSRALLVGAPHGPSLRALRGAGFLRLDLAVDPPGLVQAARAFLPSWKGLTPDRVVASPAAAPGPYSLVLLRDQALWQRRRNPFRADWLRSCSHSLAEDGVCVAALDPERGIPGLIGAVAMEMRAAFPRVELWLLPNGWRTPRLLCVGRRVAPDRSAGFAEDPDLGPLFLGADDELAGLPHLSYAGPFPRLSAELAPVEYRRVDQIRPALRAGTLLRHLAASLEPERVAASLLPFYAAHLAGQLYDVRDTLPSAPPEDWLDVNEDSLQALLATSRRRPDSTRLRRFWAELAPMLAAKREVAWVQEYLGTVVDELGWKEPELLDALADAALEMLEPEAALERAEEALALRPGDRIALELRARSLAGLKRHREALAAFAATASSYAGRTLVPDETDAIPETVPSQVLREWAEEALDGGESQLAVELARRCERLHGEGGLGSRLRELIGIDSPDQVHVLEGMEDR